MDELIFELTQPLKGTGSDMLVNFAVRCFVPAALLTVLITLVYFTDFIRIIKVVREKLIIGFLGLSFIFALICVIIFWNRLDITDYIKNSGEESTFIENNFVDASNVEISFPDKKRNLIYIFLESMEITYSDKENGGGFELNCIPELTNLAQESECFSANGLLNGGLVLPGTTWTMGGLFAQTSGMPLKLEMGENMMETQESFFPTLKCLGDILQEQGYYQELLIGSDAVFGGRDKYFSAHGNYALHDYTYAIDNGIIPSDYHVFWGYEDQKLFDNAKKELQDLARKNEPFNLTMLTVDTHFPDGYVCELCRDDFAGNQYANAMACSSRQVVDFVNWIKEQDFYDNTTIIINGDHTTMSESFVSDVSDDYVRKTYTCIINPVATKERKNENVEYSTLDMFPTTLAAIGATIEGNRLALGTNLFSDEKTLVEKYGLEYVTSELKKKSLFVDSISGIVITDDIKREMGLLPDADIDVVSFDMESRIASVVVDNIVNVDEIKSVELELYDASEKGISKVEMVMNPDRSYSAQVDLGRLDGFDGRMKVFANTEKDSILLDEVSGNLSLCAHDNLSSYIGLLKKRDDIAVLIVSNGDFLSSISGIDQSALKSFGIDYDFASLEDGCFYAVVDSPSIVYDGAEDDITYEGEFIRNDVSYSIDCGVDGEEGPYCDIIVAGEHYRSGGNILDIIVYSYEDETVIDNAVFEKGNYIQIESCSPDVSVDNESATIEVSQLYVPEVDEINRTVLSGIMWDDEHCGNPISFDFSLDGKEAFSANVDISGLDRKSMYLELYLLNDKTKRTYKCFDWHGDITLLRSELSDYLMNMALAEGKVIAMSVKNDALQGLDLEEVEAMKKLGLTGFESMEESSSYYALISPVGIAEETGQTMVTYESEIDGALFKIESAGRDAGSYSSIMINGTEYSRNCNGINIVVYDTGTGSVSDAVTFDLCSESREGAR